MVVSLFSDVENTNIDIPSWTEHPFGDDELKKLCYIAPIKDMRLLSLTWPMPDMRELYKTCPSHYVGHLIGHEGEGSLLSFLKAKGWVNMLMAGQRAGAKGFAFFAINCYLSEEGIDHIDDIIEATFQYLKLLTKEGPKEWIFDEVKFTSISGFNFKDKERPQDYVSCKFVVLSMSSYHFFHESFTSAQFF